MDLYTVFKWGNRDGNDKHDIWSFVFCLSFERCRALGQLNQKISLWNYGNQEYDNCYKENFTISN